MGEVTGQLEENLSGYSDGQTDGQFVGCSDSATRREAECM